MPMLGLCLNPFFIRAVQKRAGIHTGQNTGVLIPSSSGQYKNRHLRLMTFTRYVLIPSSSGQYKNTIELNSMTMSVVLIPSSSGQYKNRSTMMTPSGYCLNPFFIRAVQKQVQSEKQNIFNNLKRCLTTISLVTRVISLANVIWPQLLPFL